MRMPFQFSLLWTLSKEHLGLFAVACLGLASLMVGGWGLWHSSRYLPQYHFAPKESTVSVDVTEPKGASRTVVAVDVSGAVVHPGIYELSDGSRVQDAVLMAGGFQANSDQRYIHHELNLAKKLVDQQKIYIPFKGEETEPSVVLGTSEKALNVNLATKEELMKVPGIGEKRAEDIIAGRPYSTLEEFKAKSKVSASILETMMSSDINMTL